MRLRSWCAAVWLGAGAALAAAPAAVCAADAPVLRVGLSGAIGGFDPATARDMAGVSAREAVYEGLVAYSPGEVTITGRLAQSWTVSKDELTYSFTLRDNIAFHDGGTMRSQDVLASFERLRTLPWPLSRAVSGVAAMETPDPETFVVHLARPLPWFLDALAGAWGPKIVSAAALTAHAGGDRAHEWLDRHDAGTGPYRLAFVRSSGVTLRRFDGYWGERPHYAEVQTTFLPEPIAQVLALHAHRLDVLADGYPPDVLDRLPRGYTASSFPAMTLLLAFPNPLGALSREELRQASVAPLNPKYWLAELYGGHAASPESLFPRAMLESPDPLELNDNVAQARRTVIRSVAAPLSLGYPLEDAIALRRTADLLAAQLHGINLVVSEQPIPMAAAARFAREPSFAPDLFVMRVSPGEADPAAMADLVYRSDAPGNLFGLINPSADRLLRQGAQPGKPTAMIKAYYLAGERLFNTGLAMPLAELNTVIVHRDRLRGVVSWPAFPPGSFDYARVTEAD